MCSQQFCPWYHYQSINGKYLRCFRYCLLWSLGQDSLFYLKRYSIFAAYQWLLDALSFYQILFLFLSFFGLRQPHSSSKTQSFYIYTISLQLFSSNELSMSWTFRLRVSWFFGPYLCCWLTLFPDSSYCCSFSKHYSFGLELISCSSPHSSSRLSPISLFPPFSSAKQSFLSFKTSSNDKTEVADFLWNFHSCIFHCLL